MPKRTDIHSILILGSGPIVIGQACEFDYAGAQACKVLRREGYRIVLVNSNPATIMTDPEFADATYVEPLVPEILEKIIAHEKPDALLPTVGGQTALNLAVELAQQGTLDRYGLQLIGASRAAIEIAEEREKFKGAMRAVGLDVPNSAAVSSVEQALAFANQIGYPVLIRPSFTLGGSGAGIARNEKELMERVERGLRASPVHQVLMEESVLGWKEFELEVMRDRADNFVVVCSIENLDPMGVHTGDSITVAPAQTLTDREYQRLRDAARLVMRAVGVETGGSNVQFAVNPQNGRIVVIEMNPRVSRSSALASKATGFPIAKIAALLAVGYTLDEIRNDITRETPASFEPTIDYVVTKVPRFTFEKFSQADDRLTTQMKSVGEVMAIGRTFQESLHKAMRSRETGSFGFESKVDSCDANRQDSLNTVREKLRQPNAARLWYVGDAYRLGMSTEEIFQLSAYDAWFLEKIRELVAAEDDIAKFAGNLDGLDTLNLRAWKQMGFADARIAKLTGSTEDQIRRWRIAKGIEAVFNSGDTCGAEL